MKNFIPKIKKILPLLLAISANLLNTGCVSTYIKNLIHEMTVEEKVGQLFMVGGLGKYIANEELFSKYHFGNIFLGYTDINQLDSEQIKNLTNKLQIYAKKYNRGIPLLIATDQEGGKVNRLKNGTVIYPDQEYIGNNVSLPLAKKAAKFTAIQLRASGINTNFSPVADVNTNTSSHIAKYGRSFNGDPAKVAEYAAAYLEGYKEAGVIGCLKHFPGYGDVSPDPHKTLPVTYKSYSQLKKCELIPYNKVIKRKKTDMIMTAHIALPDVTGNSKLPATLSKDVMEKILRKDLGFKGVIITDDFNMGAIEKEYGIEKLAVQCINSGVDILLFVGRPSTQKSVWKSICNAVKNGEISKKRIDESVYRILHLKYKYSLFNNKPANKTLIDTSELHKLLQQITSSSPLQNGKN